MGKQSFLTKLCISFLLIFLTVPVLLSQDYYEISKVIDGDTIKLENGETVRLIGIDTPETVHPSKAVEYYGKEASNFTRMMAEGKRVRLEFDVQTRDKYNRLLAYVYLEDGTFVNAELVKEGYAKVSTYPPNVKYADLFTELQKEARENNKGLWAPEREKITTPQKPILTGEETVYVTKTGKKYHIAGCRYLSRSMIPISLREAVYSYGPCSVCNPPVLDLDKPIQEEPVKKSFIVYVTRTGSKYHLPGCRYLRTSSIPMPLEEAKRRYSPCSVCNPPR